MAAKSTLKEAVKDISNGERVFVHGGAATPNALLAALVARAGELKNVEFIHLHTEGPALYADSKLADSFRIVNLFVGPNLRKKLDYSRNDYLPCFLSEVPALLRNGPRKPDVALVHVSPPDKHGYCSLGVSVDVAVAAVQTAKKIIAQVNPRMPRVHGDGFVHLSSFHKWVEVSDELYSPPPTQLTAVHQAIGKNVASLVEDGATLQVGIGAIPEAVLGSLGHLKHLGLHTELFSDRAANLIEAGIIDNSQKKVIPGKSVSAFIIGSRRVYDLIDDNPAIRQLGADFVNSPHIISQNPKVTAINSAVEVDLSGQVCADSIGPHIISGVGGQMDFMRGAQLSPGGKPIIALPSRTSKGESRLVAALKPAAGVVTTRAHARFVVTEYGIADLYGKTLGERAQALIQIAHPDDRENLNRAWRELFR